jgi:hypothetical protein
MNLSVIKEAINILDTIGRLPSGAITFTNAVYTIFEVIGTVLEMNGAPGWHLAVNKAMGQNVLTAHDEARLNPLITMVMKLKNASSEQPLETLIKRGGGDDDEEGGIDMDKMVVKGINSFKQINEKVKDFAKRNGITKFERLSDRLPDLHPFATNLALVPSLKPLRLERIPLPFRTILFVVHSVLDLVRLAVSIPGADIPILRQILSAALAAMELLRGDWKTALLSAAGLFGPGLAYLGFIFKIFLEMFYMVSPTLQDEIFMGAYRVTKSMIVGFLLEIFKITATYETRMEVMTVFDELSAREKSLDRVLKEAGLPGRARIDGPMNTEGVHGVLDDRNWNCSEEFQSIVAISRKNAIMRLLLQLCNIPTSTEDTLCKSFADHVDKQGYKKWKDLLKAEGLSKLTSMPEEVNGPNIDIDGSAASGDDEFAAQFAKLRAELEKVKQEWTAAMTEEEHVETQMLDALEAEKRNARATVSTVSTVSTVFPASNASTAPPSTSIPSLAPTSPIHVDISWAGQGPVGISAAPNKIAESPIEAVESPTGSAESPTGSAESPTGAAESPTGSAESPTGAVESPTGPATSTASPSTPSEAVPPPQSQPPPSDEQKSDTPSETPKSS